MKIKSVLFVLVFSLVSCAVNAMHDDDIDRLILLDDIDRLILSGVNASDEELRAFGQAQIENPAVMAVYRTQMAQSIVQIICNINDNQINVIENLSDAQIRGFIELNNRPAALRFIINSYVANKSAGQSNEIALGNASLAFAQRNVIELREILMNPR